ncbi:MAG: glycoside hydrolase family 25 protein [Anaerolineaceae bacterium]
MIFGVDVSTWQKKVDWQVLKAGGVDFALVKASQGSQQKDARCEQHLRGAQAAGLLSGVYHWCDPTCRVESQINNFMSAGAGLSFDFCALDVEQYWCSWQEWSQHQITHKLTPRQISTSARDTATAIRERTGKPTLIYTRASFVSDYARPMLEWLSDWDLWLAFYPFDRGRVQLEWAELTPILQHLPASPLLPEGCREWKFWQISGDKFVLPGCNSALDLNLFQGSLADLRAWCGLDTTPPANPEPGLNEKVERLWQAHPELQKPALPTTKTENSA